MVPAQTAKYLRDNLGQSFLVSPFRAPLKAWALVPVFAIIAISVGFSACHDLGNFTSFLRVCALRYLELQLSGGVPRDNRVPIASLDADRILAGKPGEPAAPEVVSKARH